MLSTPTPPAAVNTRRKYISWPTTGMMICSLSKMPVELAMTVPTASWTSMSMSLIVPSKYVLIINLPVSWAVIWKKSSSVMACSTTPFSVISVSLPSTVASAMVSFAS